MEYEAEVEISEYKTGGYHPVHIGEIFQERYIIIEKLGIGHFSTVWLALDIHQKREENEKGTPEYVALKIQKSENKYYEAGCDEIKLLSKISTSWEEKEWNELLTLRQDTNKQNSDSCHCVQFLNSFPHYGPNGKHLVMIFELMGLNLYEKIQSYNYKGLPIEQVRLISLQILTALDYLHNICKIIHTDLKPENILFKLTAEDICQMREQGSLGPKMNYKYPVSITGTSQSNTEALPTDINVNKFDNEGRELTPAQILKKQKKALKKKRQKAKKLGNIGKIKCNSEEKIIIKIADFGNGCWIDDHFSKIIQTREYRAPEILIGGNYTESTDIWSLGCLIFELITGNFLFDPKKRKQYTQDEDHLALISEVIGKPNKEFALSGRYSKDFYNRTGNLRNIKQLKRSPINTLLQNEYECKKNIAECASSFLLGMMKWEPKRRVKIRELLKHPFVVGGEEEKYWEEWEMNVNMYPGANNMREESPNKEKKKNSMIVEEYGSDDGYETYSDTE